ncbi:uncharacterized protein VTP21DRAFT_4789 [Calcarisporiella thermophila]|uniref:uncharacterized protein n=1 Tax=Calcarisporiella thermophila TaxID=911321 RepID=UPI0037436837
MNDATLHVAKQVEELLYELPIAWELCPKQMSATSHGKKLPAWWDQLARGQNVEDIPQDRVSNYIHPFGSSKYGDPVGLALSIMAPSLLRGVDLKCAALMIFMMLEAFLSGERPQAYFLCHSDKVAITALRSAIGAVGRRVYINHAVECSCFTSARAFEAGCQMKLDPPATERH